MTTPSSSPDRDLSVSLRDGRTVAFAEWGPVDGRPVVLLHGMPGSRLFCPDVEETARAGVRLITIDRPGWGGSSPRPGHTLLDWVDDYIEWAELTNLPPGPIIGWSSGGPYAMACAARCAERVTTLGLAASVGPPDAVPGSYERMSEEVRELTHEVSRDPNQARARVEQRCEWFVDGWDTIFEPEGSGADDQLFADPDAQGPLLEWMREAARQGTAGYVDEWIAESVPWGFSPSEIRQDTHVWWGDDDVNVDREDAEYLAATIPNSTLRIFPGDGHLFPISRWAELLAALQ